VEESRTPNAEDHTSESSGELSRVIGPNLLALFVLGDILGAGIYARVGGVASQVGGAIWVAFLVAFLVAGLTAASYAELVSKYPGAGGAALFVNRAYSIPFFSFMVAFAVMASGLASSSAISTTFGGRYLAEFVELPTLAVALVFIVILALINFIGISESVRLNVVLTLIEVGGLLLIVLVGVVALSGGSGDVGRPLEFREDANIPIAILFGSVVAFYALIGFEDSANVAEEVRSPSRNFPRALFGGLAAAGILYILVGFTATLVVEPETLSSSSGPLLEVVRQGPLAIPTQLFSIIALVAITNTALINLIMASRLVYGMARENVIPAVFGRTHRTRHTPWVAIIFTTLVALGLIVTGGNLDNLANTTVMLLLVVFAIVNVSVLVLRRDPVDHPHFKIPAVIPVLGALSCLLLLTQQAPETYLRGGVLLSIGVVLWLFNFLVLRRQDRETRQDLEE
jgi:basic amino acid/polyamine antiporter, APA family